MQCRSECLTKDSGRSWLLYDLIHPLITAAEAAATLQSPGADAP